MANKNSRNVQELDKGTTITFKRASTGEQFQGSVLYFNPQATCSIFGIKDVSVWRVDGRYGHVPGLKCFEYNDITELQVIEVARKPSNTQDAQNNNSDDGSSSSGSIESKMGCYIITSIRVIFLIRYI